MGGRAPEAGPDKSTGQAGGNLGGEGGWIDCADAAWGGGKVGNSHLWVSRTVVRWGE